MKRLHTLLFALICAAFLTGCFFDDETPSDPMKKYVDRDKYKQLNGILLGFSPRGDTIMFTTADLVNGKDVIVISPMKGVDKDNYSPFKVLNDSLVKHKVPLKLKLHITGNPIYQLRPDTIGNTYYMERCGCPHKAFFFADQVDKGFDRIGNRIVLCKPGKLSGFFDCKKPYFPYL